MRLGKELLAHRLSEGPFVFHSSRRALAAGTTLLAITGATFGTAAAQAAPAPTAVTLVGPALRAATSATFKISTSLPKPTLTCRLDAGAWAACGTTKTVARLTSGVHTLSVRASSGHTIQTASAQVRVDTLAPHKPGIGNQSGGWTNADFKTVIATQVTDIGLAGGVTYQYRTSGWTSGHCGIYGIAKAMTGRMVNITTVGRTCVEFRAKDAVGNVSGWSGYYVVLIDRVAPSQAVIHGAVSGWHKTLTLTASATDASSGIGYYQWYSSKDDSPFTPLTINYKPSMAFATSGTYQLKVVAVDSAGNEGVASNIVTIQIDRTAPTAPTLTVPHPGEWSTDNTVSPAGSTDADSGVAHYNCYDDTTLLGSTVDADTPLQLTDGQHAVTCKAVDEAGNVSLASNLEDVMIDTVGPQIAHADGDMGTTVTSGVATLFAPDASDAGSGVAVTQFQYSDNGGASWYDWDEVLGGLNFTDTGSYLVRYRAIDAAGNVSADSNIVRVNVDRG